MDQRDWKRTFSKNLRTISSVLYFAWRADNLTWDPPRRRSSHARGSVRRTNSDLLDRRKVEIAAGWIFSDANSCFVHKIMWRNGKIIGRWNAGEDASRKIVFRSVAWAEISARPVWSGLRCAWKRLEQRNTTEVGAYSDKHAIFGLERTMPVGRVRRLLEFA